MGNRINSKKKMISSEKKNNNNTNANKNNENTNVIKINSNNDEKQKNAGNNNNKNEIIINNEDSTKNNEEYFDISYTGFKSHYNNCELAIQNDAKNLKTMKLPPNNRDLLWEIFLGVLPYKSSEDWNKIIDEERKKYLGLKKKFFTKDIEDFVVTQKVKDKYSAYFKFKEILSKEDYNFLDIIKVDVTRTFQKVELFKQEKIQKTLINVLFVFAKTNKDIGYRQGMSDLCAIFLYALYKERILDSSFIKDNISFLFYLLYSNNEYLEHDTFILFSRFMKKGYINFFLHNDEKYMNGLLSTMESQNRKNLKKDEIINANDSELKKRIFLVYYHEFPLADKQLYQFMVDKIDPEIFMVRWYLCIFSREVPLPQLLELLDLILYQQFLEEKNKPKNKNESNNYYKFVDYIVLSLLINVKALIMNKKKNSELIAFLMKYPKDIEFKNIYLKSIEIYNKNKSNINI